MRDPQNEKSESLHEKSRAQNLQWAAAESYNWEPRFINLRQDLPSSHLPIATSLLSESAEFSNAKEASMLSFSSRFATESHDGFSSEQSKSRSFSSNPDELFFYENALFGLWHRLYDTEKILTFLQAHPNELPAKDLFALLRIPMEIKAIHTFAAEFRGIKELHAKQLRVEYENLIWFSPSNLMEYVRLAYVSRKLGVVPKVPAMVKSLLDDLESLKQEDTDGLLRGMSQILNHSFHIAPKGGASSAKEGMRHQEKEVKLLSDEELLEEISVGSAEFMDNILLAQIHSAEEEKRERSKGKRKTDEERRLFIEKNYGTSILNKREEQMLERRVSTGIHRGMHPLLTRGILGENASLYRREQFAAARRENLSYLSSHRATIQRSIRVLQGRLRAGLRESNEESEEWQKYGMLAAERAWRAIHLNDGKVFRHRTHDSPSSLRVDLLLDASASQADRRAEIAAQGYILAKALSGVHIPFRATSFQSQQGYTILHLLKSFEEVEEADSLLNYFPDGANRDGFALRILREQITLRPGQHHLIIVLSDGKPFDQRVLLNAKSYAHIPQYRDAYAVDDTAEQVRRLRRDGIGVFGIFTGEEADLPAAKRIYGASFAYIRTPERFANVVAKVLEEEIGQE